MCIIKTLKVYVTELNQVSEEHAFNENTKDYSEKIRNKIEAFRYHTKIRKAIQVAFITTYGVRQNMYSGIIQRQVILDDFTFTRG